MNMKTVVHVVLALHEEGKEINEENLSKALEAIKGSLSDEDKAAVKLAVSSVQGKDISEVIKTAAVAPVAAAPAAAAPAEEEKKKEEKEEKKGEEEAAAGLAGLFG